MATEITNYQCPNCTGPMHFDGASGKLKCDFCESIFDTAEIEAMYKEKEEKSSAVKCRYRKHITYSDIYRYEYSKVHQ